MKILMVLTSHDQLGNTGKKTGFWLEEFVAPSYVQKDAEAEITLASLFNVRGKDSEYLVKSKRVTGFTNGEEEAAGLSAVVPFLLEGRLKERGGL